MSRSSRRALAKSAAAMAFDDSRHPRDDKGRFSGGGGPTFSQTPLWQPSVQARSPIRSSMGAWSNVVGLPVEYTGENRKSDPVDSYKTQRLTWQQPDSVPEARHQDLRRGLLSIVQRDRAATIARGIEGGLIPEGTDRKTVHRAYNHGAFLALHDYGVADYDFAMSDHLKADLQPLKQFILYGRRRLKSTMLGERKGEWKPYRKQFGQEFADQRRDKTSGEIRLRTRPNQELIKRSPHCHPAAAAMMPDQFRHMVGQDTPLTQQSGPPAVSPHVAPHMGEIFGVLSRHGPARQQRLTQASSWHTTERLVGNHRTPIGHLAKFDETDHPRDDSGRWTNSDRGAAIGAALGALHAIRLHQAGASPLSALPGTVLRVGIGSAIGRIIDVIKEQRAAAAALAAEATQTPVPEATQTPVPEATQTPVPEAPSEPTNWGRLAAYGALGAGTLAAGVPATRYLGNRMILAHGIGYANRATGRDLSRGTSVLGLSDVWRNRGQIGAHIRDIWNQPTAVGKVPTGKELRRQFARDSLLSRERLIDTDRHGRVIADVRGNGLGVDPSGTDAYHVIMDSGRKGKIGRTYHNHPVDTAPSTTDSLAALQVGEWNNTAGAGPTFHRVYGFGQTTEGKTRVRVSRYDHMPPMNVILDAGAKYDAARRDRLFGKPSSYRSSPEQAFQHYRTTEMTEDSWNAATGRGSNYRTKAVEKLAKGFDSSKHPREHDGKFGSKTGEIVGRFARGAAGAAGGFYLGSKHGESLGEGAGSLISRGVNRVISAVSPSKGWVDATQREFAETARVKSGQRIGAHLGGTYGRVIGGAALGLGGYLAGSHIGAAVDEHGRRSRAISAGKLANYERLNAKVSPTPSKTKQVKRAAEAAMSSTRKIGRAHDFISSL